MSRIQGMRGSSGRPGATSRPRVPRESSAGYLAPAGAGLYGERPALTTPVPEGHGQRRSRGAAGALRPGRPGGVRAPLRSRPARNSTGWRCVSSATAATPRKPCRRPSSRSGTAPAGSTPGAAARIGWLVSIARNQAIDQLRARRAPTRDIAEMPELADQGPTPEASALGADERRRIERCLGDAAARPGAGGDGRLRGGLELRGPGAALRGAAQHHAHLAPAGADQPQGVPRAMIDDDAQPPERPGDADAALAAEYVLRLLGPAGGGRLRRARGARPRLRRAGRGVAGGSFEGLDGAFAPVAPPAAAAGPHRGAALRGRSGRPGWRGSGGSVGLWRAVAAAAALVALYLGVVWPPVRSIGAPARPRRG